jgi:hypothetical protein
MAIISGIVTVDQVLILELDTDPSVGSGAKAPIGSYATALDGDGSFYKFGSNDTDWMSVSSDVNLSNPPSNDLTANGVKLSITAGENLVFGDIVYIKSDGKAWKANATDSTTSPAFGMSLGTIAANSAGVILLSGIVRKDAWTWATFGVAGMLYVNTTSGTMTQSLAGLSSTGNAIQVLGQALSATIILFNPSPDYITHS